VCVVGHQSSQALAAFGRPCRFWDCCGDEDQGSPGCEASFHVAFDEELNMAQGWR
jgi:hypothetical protein